MKKVLITGGTGSLGQRLTERLLEDPSIEEIRVYSRNEKNQYLMNKHFNNPRLTFFIGDVKDYTRLVEASKGVDTVIHAAALKHIDLGEKHPEEFVKTNVLGTINVIKACDHNQVKDLVYVSTDKACQPANLYGMTKAIGEKLVCGDGHTVDSQTRRIAVRYGNVAASNGSVIPFFRKFVEEGKSLPLTHTEMTRFFITLHEAVDLILFAYAHAKHKEIFVRKAPSFKIKDLAEFMLDYYSAQNKKIDIIGFKSHGEKVHEILISDDESARTENLGDYLVIRKHIIGNKTGAYSSEITKDKEELVELFKKIDDYEW